MSNDNKDLPLNSLNSDFIVLHYLIDLKCIEELRIFRGRVHTFVTPTKNCGKDRLLILDAKDLVIQSVEQVEVDSEEIKLYLTTNKTNQKVFQYWASKSKRKLLKFSIDEWYIKIEMDDSTSDKLILIEYETLPKGNSLSWFSDGDDTTNFYVLTAGSLINNRSLLPYQDAPNLMATWELTVQVSSKSLIVLATGEDNGTWNDENQVYFYTQMLLPLSTFALAIGNWDCKKLETLKFNTTNKELEEQIQYRVFSSKSTNISAMIQYLPICLKVLHQVLGRNVVRKMDFLVVPKLVAYLGLASPGLFFISPTVLFGENPMLQRLTHEVSHSWFGISLGPKNWNEEWISEGFATFMEDSIHIEMTETMSTRFKHEWMQLKSLNRYQILKSDCQNVDKSLHRVTGDKSDGDDMVSNGLNRERMVSQIPYLKGYFFLVGLSSLLGGPNRLLTALKKYVQLFRNRLISTEECINFFRQELHAETDIQKFQKLVQDWLYNSHLPDGVIDVDQLYSNQLYVQVLQHLQFWKRKMQRRDRRKSGLQFPPSLARPDQLVALFDQLLEIPDILPGYIVRNVLDHYQPHLVNADVFHRACELIVANRFKPQLILVRQFLLDHPAMGAYLYGELMLTDVVQFHNVALEAFGALEKNLEPDFRAIVYDIISQ